MKPASDRRVLRYLKLEEDDVTASLLVLESIRYLGPHVTDTGTSHFWSFPTSSGVAWAKLDANGSLGTTEQVPQSVRDLTLPREEHKMRKVATVQEALPLAQRTNPQRPVWIPDKKLPSCHLSTAWSEKTSFESAVEHYGAKVTHGKWAGPGSKCFYIQLTSGRYACIETNGRYPEKVSISLEIDRSSESWNSGGHFHIRDIEEILAPMGKKFSMPTENLFVGWRADE